AVEVLREKGFPIARDSVARGLAAVRWPARIEVIHERPYVVVDVAHNPASIGALRASLESMFPGRRIILVFGMVATHDHRASTSLIAPLADTVIVTTPQHMKPLPAPVLADEVRRYANRVEIVEDRGAAVDRALSLAGEEDVVVITGSFFLVGEVREALYRNGRWVSRTQV
ncbi:MAG: glutamate ligase domain-containing protein, partial [bacterium]